MIMIVWHKWHGPARGNIHINFQIRDEKSRVKGQVLSNDDDLHTVEKHYLTYLLHVTRRRYVGQKVIITVSFGPSVGRRYSR